MFGQPINSKNSLILFWSAIDLTPRLIRFGCYAQGFIVVCVLRFLKYSKISSFVILDNFSLNLSRC